MDIQKMIAELRMEREFIDGALISLHKLALKRTPRRGRPPGWNRVSAGPEKKPQRVAKRPLQHAGSSKGLLSVGMGGS